MCAKLAWRSNHHSCAAGKLHSGSPSPFLERITTPRGTTDLQKKYGMHMRGQHLRKARNNNCNHHCPFFALLPTLGRLLVLLPIVLVPAEGTLLFVLCLRLFILSSSCLVAFSSCLFFRSSVVVALVEGPEDLADGLEVFCFSTSFSIMVFSYFFGISTPISLLHAWPASYRGRQVLHAHGSQSKHAPYPAGGARLCAIA